MPNAGRAEATGGVSAIGNGWETSGLEDAFGAARARGGADSKRLT
jgi:hypothetical protein